MSSAPVPTVRTVTKKGERGHSVGFVIGESSLLIVFAVLAFIVDRHPGPLLGDAGIELDVQHALLPHVILADPIEAVSTLNWPVPATITLAVIVIIFLFLRRWLDVLVVVATAAVAEGTSSVLSAVIHRPRPSGHGIHVLSVIRGSYSFPSGHVLYAVAVFGLFLFLSGQVRRPFHPAIVWFVRVVAAAVIVLMPISRILEGEHWPSDVLGGFLYGAFWLVIAAHVYLWARKRWPHLLARDER